MKIQKALLIIVIAMCSILASAQSNQSFQQKTYYASDYGTWQIKGQSANNYQFSPPEVCQINPPSETKPFIPFNTNAPVVILDAQPSNTEVVTPTSVVSNASYCGIIAQPIHTHYSFSLLSGTAGLQEVLNQISSSIIFPTEVILDRNWYTALTSIPGSSASAIINSVKGSTAAYLVDKTQAPNVYYTWNSGARQYQAVASGGGAVLPNTGVVFANNTTTGATATSPQIVAGLNATPSTTLAPALLPFGTSATIGAVQSDGTTTSISGSGVISAIPPTGTANLIVATPNGSSGTASPRAMVAADMPVATSGAFGAVKPDNITITASGGVITSVAGGTTTPATSFVLQGNGSINGVVASHFTDTGTVGAYTGSGGFTMPPLATAISGTNQNSGFSQFCGSYWTGSAAANDCYTVQNIVTSGTNPVTLLNFGHTGSSGSPGEFNFDNQVTLAGGAALPSATNFELGGMDAAILCSTAQSNGNLTPCGSVVTQTALYTNQAYMGVSNLNQRFNVSGFPSSCTTSQGSFTSQLECAWFMVYDIAVANSSIVELDMGFGYYLVTHSLYEPTQNFTGISLKGTGPQASVILVNAPLTNAAIYKNETAPGGALPNLEFSNFKIQGNAATYMAGGCMKIWGVQELKTEHLNCIGVPGGTSGNAPFLYQFGEPNNYGQGWVFQHSSYDVIGGNGVAQGSGAVITASQSGGALSLVVANGGTGYASNSNQIPYLVLMGNKGGTSDEPCSVMPSSVNITLSGTAVSGITFSGGTGCSGTIEASIVEVSNIPIGMDIWSTDSDIYATVPLSTLVGVTVHGGNTRLYGTHPTYAIIGIQNIGNDTFYGSELDTGFQWGMDFEQTSPYLNPATVIGTSTFNNLPNFAVYHFNSSSIVKFGAQNGLCEATTPNDYHEFLGPTGTVENTGWSAINGGSISGNDTTCSAIALGDFNPSAYTVGTSSANANVALNGSLTVTGDTNTPTGTATPGSNFSSHSLLLADSYSNGSVPLNTRFSFTVNPGTGNNPLTFGDLTFTGCPSGGCQLNMHPFTVFDSTALFFGLATFDAGIAMGGSSPTITGCGTISSQHGGATAGSFTTSTTGTCSAAFALPAAPNGWYCSATDITQHSNTNALLQSATSTASCTVTGTTAASDVITFSAVAY